MEYTELHCHSFYSLLDGASSPEALVEQAAALGYRSLALTDHNGLYGAVRFWQAAQEKGIQAITGAEVTLANDDAQGPTGGGMDLPPIMVGDTKAEAGHLTLLVETQQGYANLCRLLSVGQLAGQKAHPWLTLETLSRYTKGLFCLSGCRQGAIARALLTGKEDKARHMANQLWDAFGPGHFWIEVQRHYLPTDVRLVAELVIQAKKLGIGIVATNNIHYVERYGQRLHDVLTCIRQRTTLPEALAAGLLHPNSEQFLKPPAEMASLFVDLPEALDNTQRIAEQCDTRPDFSAQRLPTFSVPKGHTISSYLRHLCDEGLPAKLQPVPPQARAQLAHELAVIEGAGLAGYFLVVWDIVRFAREQGIRCQGRGSAANSLVAYLLGITPVDPLRHNLLFERFLSEGSHTMPDIDVDFAADRREEVIQYVYERYGEEHVAMVCNVVTYRARSAVRDVAKALVFPPDVVDRAAKALDTRSTVRAVEELPGAGILRLAQTDHAPSTAALPWQLLAELIQQMDGVPRHLSIHVGGMLITAAPLVEVVPLERATMPGRVVVQWDKDSLEDAGLIKIDLLSLRTLGMIEETLRHIREQRELDLAAFRTSPSEPDLDHLSLEDPAIYDLLQRADTLGCFQVESRAQAQMLPKMQPTCFQDLVIEVALIRPGPIQGGMVHPYLRRRQGLEPTTYLHPALESALAETLGVIVFQEQVMRVAMAVAGFTPAEADRLRRAMSRSRSYEAMAALREHFLHGAQANGVDEAVAGEIFRQLAGFAGFGFCKSHAAAFALVAYQTLTLKAHFPAEFACAVLNHQPMGFYPPEVIAADAQRHDIPVLHPDVNCSQSACTLDRSGTSLSIRLGLRYIHGLGEAWQTRIVERRENEPFQELREFCLRTRLPRGVVENLIRAGAMDSLTGLRRDLLWELGALDYQEEGLGLEVPVEPATLPALARAERLAWEVELMGMPPGDHVMNLYREAMRSRGVLSSGELGRRRDGQVVQVAGLVIVRQRPPTAKGHVFITLEDEEGLINLIARPDVYQQFREALRNTSLLWVEGRLQREGLASSILIYRAAALNTT